MIQLVILIYMWPLMIAPDPNMPLKWHYPFTCACLRAPKVNEIYPDDEEAERKAKEETFSFNLDSIPNYESLDSQLLRPVKGLGDNQSAPSDRLARIAQRSPQLAPEEHILIDQDIYEPVDD